MHNPCLHPRQSGPARRLLSVVATVTLAAWLAACGSKVKLDEAPVENRTARPTTPAPAEPRATTPAPGGTAAATGSAAGTAALSPRVVTPVTVGQGDGGAATGWPAERVVYFDFDSFALRPDAKPVIEGHARVLAANKGARLLLEGHTDERGGREYNLALGQKRAEAVARSLVLLGAADSQLEPVSFGKERPAVQGSDEAAWEKNRRVELKDRR